MAYPISRADLSVAAAGTGQRGELRDRDATLAAAHQAISTPGPITYQTWAHGVTPYSSSEGTAWRKHRHVKIRVVQLQSVSLPCGMGMEYCLHTFMKYTVSNLYT